MCTANDRCWHFSDLMLALSHVCSGVDIPSGPAQRFEYDLRQTSTLIQRVRAQSVRVSMLLIADCPCTRSLMPEASGWHITRVTPASIVEPAVPTAPVSPFGPGRVIAILAVGISRFPGRTIDALGVAAWADMLGRCGPCCQGESHDSAENFEFHHAFLDSRDKKRTFR